MKFPRHQVEDKARERGYNLSDIEACFISQYPDGEWEVDVDHPAYPRARPPRVIPRMVKGGQSSPLPAKPVPGKPTKVILSNFQAPGDGVVLTAAIRDLHRAWPGRFITDIRCPWRAVFDHNPNITAIDDTDKEAVRMRAEYPGIHQSNKSGIHFIQAFADGIGSSLGVTIPITDVKGDIHLSSDELAMPPQVEGDYWLGNFGSKKDFGNKQYSIARYAEIVTRLRGEIRFVQVGENHPDHTHVPIDGAVNLLGKTTLRQLFLLVYHSKGILTGNSMLMHLAAAVPTKTGRLRPCVVIGGGREPVNWCRYKKHKFLHTIGQLDCCATGGCWKSRVQKLFDGSKQDESLCAHPVALD